MTRLRVVLLGFAVLAAFAVAAASASAAPFVYATSPTAGIVSEFDAAAGTLRPVANAGTGSAPFAVSVTPDGTSV
jgi:streptogramin lyase